MTTPGVVRTWSDGGWGVVDSEETPGGCWVHWTAVHVPGFRELTPGQRVELEWERAAQDGCEFRATRTWPAGQDPVDDVVRVIGTSTAYRTSLALTFDGSGDGPGVGPSDDADR